MATLSINFTATISSQEVSISVRRQQDVASAPFAIYLDAVPSGFSTDVAATDAEFDPSYHDIEYLWSVEKIGDASWATSTYPKLSKVPSENQAKGTKWGRRIAHVFGADDITGSSSTFRFTVTAIEVSTGETATSSSYDVEVFAPDSFWSADETFVVRKSASTSYPSTNNSIYTTISAARNAASVAASGGSIDKFRICVERGQVYDEGFLNVYGGPDAYLIDAWGTGDNPVTTDDDFYMLRNNTSGSVTSIQIANIDREPGTGKGGFTLEPRATEPDTIITVYDCTVDGVTELYAWRTNDFNGYLTFANCAALGTTSTITSALKSGKATAYICNLLTHVSTQDSDQRSGGGYGLRPESTAQFYLSQNEIFVRQGWFRNAPAIETTQPVIRLWYDVQVTGARAHLERNYIEGEITVCDAIRQSGNVSVSNFLFERNTQVGVHDTGYFIAGIGSGTIRNNHFMRPPSPPACNLPTNVLFGTAYFFASWDQDETWSDRAPHIYNNTFVSLLDLSAAPAIVDLGTGVATPVEANNVLHAPNADTPTVFGTFTKAANAAPHYDGFDNRRGTVGDPQYQINIDDTSEVGTFTVGETVEGQTSGFQKVYRDRIDVFRGIGDAPHYAYLFDASVIYDSLSAAGVERFTEGEQLLGLTSGATVNVSTGGGLGQSADTGYQLVGLIPDSVTPTHQVTFSGAGGFVAGETVTTASGTATVCQVIGDTIYLVDPTGSIADSEAITSASGSGTTTSAIASSGVGDLWTPTSNNTPDSLYSPYDLLCNARTSGNAIKGSLV